MFQSLSGLTLGLNFVLGVRLLRPSVEFQSLSGLTLGLNHTTNELSHEEKYMVSIPFRADTGFERLRSELGARGRRSLVSIPFRADTGFEPEVPCQFT